MKPKIISKVSLVAFLLLSLAASLANAQSEPVYSRGDWVVGLNATRVLTDEDLRSASAGGAPVPNSNLSINNDTTISFDVSYFLSNQLAFNIFGGIPASADLQGEESLSGLFLGQTDYGPVILSLQYHVLTGRYTITGRQILTLDMHPSRRISPVTWARPLFRQKWKWTPLS